MIKSCAIYDDKANLLSVLKYYNSRHQNVPCRVLESVLFVLMEKLDW